MKLVLLFAIFAAPVVLAYAMHFFWKPTRFSNYGALIPPTPVREGVMTDDRGRPFAFSDLKGKWVLVHADVAACPPACIEKLYIMRQVRTAQGDDQARIERLWLVSDDGPLNPKALAEYAGTRIVRVRDAAINVQFPAPHGIERHIFLVDPLGNLMMRYPPDPDASRVLKDLKRLLRVSQIG